MKEKDLDSLILLLSILAIIIAVIMIITALFQPEKVKLFYNKEPAQTKNINTQYRSM